MRGYREKSAFYLILWLSVAVMTLAFRTHEARSEDRAPASADTATVQAALKGAVVDAKDKLGDLEPWQRSLFDEEVVPQYQRFVRDYRPTVAGLAVEVDKESIRKFLAFHSKKSLNRDASPIIVVERSEKGCAKCVASEEAVRKQLQQRLERRGFSVQFVELEQLGVPGAAAPVVEAKAADLARERDAAGALTALLGPAPVDSIDDAHGDEKRIRIRTKLVVWRRSKAPQPSTSEEASKAAAGADAVSTAPVGEHRSEFTDEEQMELPETDAIELAAARTLDDAMAGIGSKISADVGVNAPEFEVSVSGVKDYKQYAALKAQLESALVNAGPIEERMVSRGQAVFAIRTTQRAEDLKTMIARASSTLGAGQIVVVESGENLIKAELR